jgi:hypothetical protein
VLDVGNVTEGTFGGTDVSSVSLETEFDGIEMPALSSGARALPPAEGEPTLKAHTAGRPETTGRLLQVVAGARSAPAACRSEASRMASSRHAG